MNRGSCKSHNLDSNAHSRYTQLQVLCNPLKLHGCGVQTVTTTMTQDCGTSQCASAAPTRGDFVGEASLKNSGRPRTSCACRRS